MYNNQTDFKLTWGLHLLHLITWILGLDGLKDHDICVPQALLVILRT